MILDDADLFRPATSSPRRVEHGTAVSSIQETKKGFDDSRCRRHVAAIDAILPVHSVSTHIVSQQPPACDSGQCGQLKPLVSWSMRQRIRSEMEHDAPEQVLDQIRAIARRPGQSGISAWRIYREESHDCT